MNETLAIQILQALIQGIDPTTHRELPADTVLQRPEVIRALLLAVSALNQSKARAARRKALPPNVGRDWSQEEQASLVAAFKSGDSVDALASRHGRTLRAIESRLALLGLLKNQQRRTLEPDFLRQSKQTNPQRRANRRRRRDSSAE